MKMMFMIWGENWLDLDLVPATKEFSYCLFITMDGPIAGTNGSEVIQIACDRFAPGRAIPTW